mmetsp:Transcript_40786/g.135007  ORF Transcript_40786/g.135007 Transcript_40786/m.135007 type:complete len:371 (-) Transcript_40786:1428-2540(-)
MRLVAASLAATAAAVYLVRRRRRRWSVVAFYLLHEADVDELPLLEAAAASLSPGVTLSWGTEMSRAPPEATVFVARLPSAEALDSLKRLRAVIVPFAGPTVTTRLLLRARPHLSLHNAHFNAQSTSELAVGLLLAAAKGVLARDARLRAESLRGEQPWTAGWAVGGTSAPPPTLGGRTALVLGYGAVGGRVAKALQGLGMHVLACRRSAARPHFDGVATVHPSADLDALLRRAFVLVVCLPGTADTEALVGARQLALLPVGALLVNVGRGSVVEEAPLYAALRDGQLGGAGLDVWYNYPMLKGQGLGNEGCGPSSVGCPFHELPNVVMSPHCGQLSDSKARDRVAELVGMLEEGARCGEIPNRYDVERGY